MPPTVETNINLLKSNMHQSSTSGDFDIVAAGDDTYRSQATGLLDSGNDADVQLLKNHFGREYYRKLHQFGLDHLIKDQVDPGFRPITITGFYYF
jgi:hypothetical protein